MIVCRNHCDIFFGCVQGRKNLVLTPNVAELGRIATALGMPLEGPANTAWQASAPRIAAALGGPVLVSKVSYCARLTIISMVSCVELCT